MFARALIILLVVLNLGVAAWWLARDASVPAVAAVEPVPGVARLQLLRESTHNAPATATAASRATSPPVAPSIALTATEAPAAAAPVATAPVDAAPHCYALGPFADADSLAAARRQLQPRAARLTVRETPADKRRGWRVWLPPQADRAAAQALVERIATAGFTDYLIVASGDEANSISLGRYGSEPSARRHEAALKAAGFTDVRAEALGGDPAMATWIDIAATAPLGEAEGRALGAQQVRPIECDTVPSAPAAATR